MSLKSLTHSILSAVGPTLCHHTRPIKQVLIITLVITLSGCSLILPSPAEHIAGNLSTAIINNEDVTTVRAALPAYVLLIEGFLQDDSTDKGLYIAAAQLFGGYVNLIENNPSQKRILTDKAFSYGKKAACLQNGDFCTLTSEPFDQFSENLASARDNDIDALYALASSWAAWIQANPSDWDRVADIAKVEAIIKDILNRNDNYANGQAHLYLGVLNTLIPPSLGGKPEIGRAHFEKAIAISNGHNLMAMVLMAKHYARLLFDKELHDKLLNEVLAADAKYPSFTLANTLAKEKANKLLASSDDYF